MTDEQPQAPDTAEDQANWTRFYVLTANDNLTVFTFVKSVKARDRDHAARLVFGRHAPVHVAVTETAWRIRRPKIEPVIRGLEDVPMPDSAVPADAPATLLDPGLENVQSPADESNGAPPPVEVLEQRETVG